MDYMQKTAIVVPCYNEENRLDLPKFSDFAQNNQGIVFIFVNDCSTDRTLEVIKNICIENPIQFLCVNLDKNVGKAEAVREGFLKAFSLQFKNVGFWDADLATPLFEINNFLAVLKASQVSIVIGARVQLLSRRIQRNRGRHYLGRAFATLVSFILGLSVYDTQCGAKLFRNNSSLRMVFGAPFKTKWIFDIEILARFNVISKFLESPQVEEITEEVPLREWHDVAGSKLKIRDFVEAAWDLILFVKDMHLTGGKNMYETLTRSALKE